jgi:hypothetical protein
MDEQDELSPDGRTLVHWAESDGRMSHVIRTPTIVDAVGGETILKLRDSGFDARITWREDGGFDVDLRHYWRTGALRVKVDRVAGTFCRLGEGGDGALYPLGEIGDYVEAFFRAAGAGRETAIVGDEQPGAENWRKKRVTGISALWVLLAAGAAAAAIWASVFRH